MDQAQRKSARHSCAHLLAAAVLNLWPKAKRTIGPPIEDGFYYDFDFGEEKISETELPKIEAEMRELLPAWTAFTHEEVSKEEAVQRFSGNEYKRELIEEFSGEGESLTIYTCGGFSDLCRGGHSDNPRQELRHFKLLSVAGAYWRGNEKNKMLTRIYGTCFPTKDELQKYLTMLAEAKKRDHRKLGKELDLFTFSDLVGAGLPLWTPKGTLLRQALDSFVWELREARGYTKVTIPHITKKDLYETSGHWQKFQSDLFHVATREGHEFAIKPMNCPHHTQIYARANHSYRDLPQRYAETTMCYRDEQTGELHGLSRLRSFTQDDAHVFCRRSQVKDEFLKIWDIIDAFYPAVGFNELTVRLSLHDPQAFEKYLGTPELWHSAEQQIRELATERGVAFFEAPGEAAFYGPKVDFIAKDSIGRQWQVATIQLDINMPERFDLVCVNEKGERERIVMIHAAIMGSIERFLSILIEHHAGAFPLWLAPVQVALLPVSQKHIDGAKKLAVEWRAAGIRLELDDSDETVGKKVRRAVTQKIPYVVVLGDRELAGGEWSVRVRGQEAPLPISQAAFVARVREEICARR